MPRSIHFSTGTHNEQGLYEDIVIESIRIYGQDVYYIPREIITQDLILGEDDSSRFQDAYMVEMYIENNDAFEGEGNLFSKFGHQNFFGTCAKIIVDDMDGSVLTLLTIRIGDTASLIKQQSI